MAAEFDNGDGVAAPAAEPSEDVGTASSAGADASENVAASDDAASTDTGTDTQPAPVAAEAGGLAGLWTMVTAEDADAPSDGRPVSFAGYRVVELLAGGMSENTVVGRTAEVSGYIELTDIALVAAKVIVKMATVRTDEGHRDSHMRQALNANEFPLAAFTLIEPVELPAGSFEVEDHGIMEFQLYFTR